MSIKVTLKEPRILTLKSTTGGTVKEVNSGNGLTGGPITSSGTLSVLANTGLEANSSGLFLSNTGVTADVYGSSTEIPIITVDEKGRLTEVSTASVAGVENYTYESSNNTFKITAGDGSLFEASINTVNNFTVTGNLTITGEQTYIQSNTVLFDDNMFILNNGLVNDTPDIGFAGYYLDTDSLNWGGESINWGPDNSAWGAANAYTGIFRDSTDGIWKVFEGYKPNPDDNYEIDTSNNSFSIADFQTDTLYVRSVNANGSVGTAGQVLHSNGTGVYWGPDDNDLTFAAGSNTQIQFNNSGSFGASAGFTFDSSTNNVFNSGSLFTSSIFNINDTDNGVIFNFGGTTNTLGIVNIGVPRFGFSGGSDPKFSLSDKSSISWTNGDYYTSTIDLSLYRDDSDILAQRRSNNPQTYRVYGTYTDSSNYERLSLSSNSTASYIQTENLGTGNAKDLYLGANNSTKMVVSANGNIGIGVTDPDAALEVNGNIKVGLINGYILDSQNNSLIRLSTNGVVINEYGANKDFRVESDTVDGALFVKGSTGYVGIGTTSPLEKLHTAGNGRFDGSGNINLILNAGSTSDNSVLQFYAGGSAYGNITFDHDPVSISRSIKFSVGGYERVTILGDGNVGIGTTSPSARLDVKSSAQGTDVLRVENTNGGVIARILDASLNGLLSIYNSSATETLRISSYSNSWFNGGNVGIGTTSPTQKLHVEGTTLINNEIHLGNSAQRILSSSGEIQLRTSSLERFRIDSSGNVGIGTTSPTSKLSVGSSGLTFADGQVADFHAGVDENLLITSHNSLASGVRILAANDADTAAVPLEFFASQYYFKTGNVGIGTTTPLAKLDVEGHLRIGVSYGIDLNNSNVALRRDANDLILGGYTGIQFRASATAIGSQVVRMKIDGATGNVGIGTTTPATTLDVEGPIKHKVYTVTTLPAAATVGAGSRAFVSDANATTFHSVVVTGGSNFVPVFSDGTNWRIG